MNVCFKDIPVYYINLDTDTEKNTLTQTLLRELGFTDITRVSGVTSSSKVVNISASHHSILKIAKAPFAIFEDDCTILNLKTEVQVPNTCDALHLGHISYTTTYYMSGNLKKDLNYRKVIDYDDIYRVEGVLGAWGIVYWTQNYADAVLASIEESLYKTHKHHDIAIANMQKNYEVYAVGSPIVGETGRYKNQTNKHITEH